MARDNNIGRRKFIGLVGGFIGTGALSNTVSAHAEQELPKDFRVEGREKVKVKYSPEKVEVKKTKHSQQLAQRYDITPPQLVTSEEFDRNILTKEEDETYPERGVEQFERDWETYLAKKDEWKEYFNEDQNEVGIQDDHADTEDWAHNAVWIYERSCSWASAGYCFGETYEITSPINIVFDMASTTSNIGDVTDELTNDGWSTTIAEYTRYAWNTYENQFEEQHASAASGPFGVIDERDHVRYWQFGSRVSMQAHRETEIEHEVISYEEAEERVADIFNEAGWNVQEDWFHIDNDQSDHDGVATGIFP